MVCVQRVLRMLLYPSFLQGLAFFVERPQRSLAPSDSGPLQRSDQRFRSRRMVSRGGVGGGNRGEGLHGVVICSFLFILSTFPKKFLRIEHAS